jgi:hypothetical protein
VARICTEGSPENVWSYARGLVATLLDLGFTFVDNTNNLVPEISCRGNRESYTERPEGKIRPKTELYLLLTLTGVLTLSEFKVVGGSQKGNSAETADVARGIKTNVSGLETEGRIGIVSTGIEC